MPRRTQVVAISRTILLWQQHVQNIINPRLIASELVKGILALDVFCSFQILKCTNQKLNFKTKKHE